MDISTAVNSTKESPTRDGASHKGNRVIPIAEASSVSNETEFLGACKALLATDAQGRKEGKLQTKTAAGKDWVQKVRSDFGVIGSEAGSWNELFKLVREGVYNRNYQDIQRILRKAWVPKKGKADDEGGEDLAPDDAV
jgi:hypothetical protein